MPTTSVTYTTQLADVVIPQEFTAYTVQNSVVSTALAQSGILVQNGEIAAQLHAGADSFTAPYWNDLPDVEADIVTDDPTVNSVPQKLTSGKQIVRKSFLHQSWSSMALASELAGSNPLQVLQNRVVNYWDRQVEMRLVATLNGILQSNVANNSSDMVYDVTAATTPTFSATAVINAAVTLGDRLDDFKAIAMHSAIYKQALINDEIQFLEPSQGLPIKTYRGMLAIVDDNLSPASGVYTTVLMGYGAIGYGLTAPRVAPGTEVFHWPQAGNGGSQDTLHSRVNLALHPLGYQWVENNLVTQSPAIADLSSGTHWTRVVQRKAVPLAFLLSH